MGQVVSAGEYRRPYPATWWLKKPSYFLFVVRELTSVFVAGYAIFLLVLLTRAGDQGALASLFEALKTPWSIGLHALALVMVVYHSVTWINLTPKVMVVWMGARRVPALLIAGTHYLGWIAVSALVAWIALRS